MVTWTNKQWGALIGGLVVFLIAIIGLGPTALVVLAAVLGYFIGKFLDGEIDVEDIQARAQGRDRSRMPPDNRIPPDRTRMPR